MVTGPSQGRETFEGRGSSAPPLDVKVSISGPLITNAQGTARSTYLSSALLQRRSEKARFGATPKVRAGLA
jgi:hypothetical protein